MRDFFRYAKHQISDTGKNISSVDASGELLSELKSVDLFSKHFSSVFNSPIDRGNYIQPLLNNVNHLSNIELSEEIVFQQLELLDHSKSPGPKSELIINVTPIYRSSPIRDI